MGTPLYRSLWRPALWAGAERVPAILLTFFCLAVGLAGIMRHSLLLIGVAPALFLVGWTVLRRLAERDPRFCWRFAIWILRRADIYRAVRNLDDR